MRLCQRNTRKDVVVAISVVLFLLANTAAISSRGRQRAKEYVCRANLQQWGHVFESFAQDNAGHLLSGAGGSFGYWWIGPLEPYREGDRLMLCPAATQPSDTALPSDVSSAWRSGAYQGSYGISGWICDPRYIAWGHGPPDNYWRTPYVQGRNKIPVFLDAWYVDAWPLAEDEPWPTSGRIWDTSTDQMIRVCVNRHDGAVNCLFMDWSVRKVGLKELWTLKWHREYDTEGPWTVTGGVLPADWPEWMRPFKDY